MTAEEGELWSLEKRVACQWALAGVLYFLPLPQLA